MKNRHLGILLVLAGVITIFVKHESAWIISAILIGGGTGIFFWKEINKFFFINGIIGSLIFYYFVRKIQTYYEVDISIDGYGLAGAVWYGAGLGFVFGVKFIRIQEIINYFRR